MTSVSLTTTGCPAGVGLIQLVDSLNTKSAISLQFIQEFDAILDQVTNDKSIRVVVIASETTYFAAGSNVKDFYTSSPEKNIELIKLGQDTFAKIPRIPKVFIAAINGLVVGAGAELALACDIRIAGSNTKISLGITEAKLGVSPGFGGTQYLPRLVGVSNAFRIMLMQEGLKADEALMTGLVHMVVDPRETVRKALEAADNISQDAPLSLATIKRCVYEGIDKTLADGLALELELAAELLHTEDARIGTEAFLQKRRAEFQGR